MEEYFDSLILNYSYLDDMFYDMVNSEMEGSYVNWGYEC